MSERGGNGEAKGPDGPPPGGRRQVVKFAFFRVDPSWRRLAAKERERTKDEFARAVESFGDRLQVRPYSLMGTRSDCDLMLWQIGDSIEDLRALETALFATAMGPYLQTPYSYLAMTRRSIYVSPAEEGGPGSRTILSPGDARYLFVYPFVKTRAWYALPKDERQRMMNDHIMIGRKYPSVKLNTTYSYGLDDQEFVVAFETDEPSDFLDLVIELRETEASSYTERDTPIFTCIAMGLREALDALGAPGDVQQAARPAPATASGWRQVLAAEDLPEGASRVVYVDGDQVAVFNAGGDVYALGNRCSHANGPLADGVVEGGCVTCPWHGSRFDLATGKPQEGPAAKPVPTYRVKVENGGIFIAGGETLARA